VHASIKARIPLAAGVEITLPQPHTAEGQQHGLCVVGAASHRSASRVGSHRGSPHSSRGRHVRRDQGVRAIFRRFASAGSALLGSSPQVNHSRRSRDRKTQVQLAEGREQQRRTLELHLLVVRFSHPEPSSHLRPHPHSPPHSILLLLIHSQSLIPLPIVSRVLLLHCITAHACPSAPREFLAGGLKESFHSRSSKLSPVVSTCNISFQSNKHPSLLHSPRSC
jgi:hypothetical protein